jgi:putative oxidoreductase
MKNLRIIYWVSTILFSGFMLMSAYSYLTVPDMKGAFAGLGFTEDFFRIELALAKLLGALALLIPFAPKWLKNFAYAGFVINIISAIIAHVAKDYHSYTMLVYSVVTLAASYYSFTKLENPAELKTA